MEQKTLTPHQLEMRKQDKYMIEHPREWPAWPFLPVKRSRRGGNWPDLGVVYAGRLTRVVDAQLFALPPNKAAFDALPFTDFESVDALLDAGWVVD